MKRIFKYLTLLGVSACLAFGTLGACKSGNYLSGSDAHKPNNVHVHSYDEDNWACDGEYHWHPATCGHGLKKSYGRHVYDDDLDSFCNTCGYEREIKKPEELPDIPETPPEEPEIPPEEPEIPPEEPEIPPEEPEIPPEEPEESPVVALRLKEGKLMQISSKTDKISESWIFVGIRENGETVGLDGGEVVVPPLDTFTEGTHTATVVFGGLTCKVEYTVLPVPEYVKKVHIEIKDVDTTVEDTLKLGVDDFAIDITVEDGAEIIDKTVTLACDGEEGGQLELSPREEAYAVKVKVEISYVAEGEIIRRTYGETFDLVLGALLDR